jgi:hypothetical protein
LVVKSALWRRRLVFRVLLVDTATSELLRVETMNLTSGKVRVSRKTYRRRRHAALLWLSHFIVL